MTLPPRSDSFAHRHLGPRPDDQRQMLAALRCKSLADLMHEVVPADIRLTGDLKLPAAKGEQEVLADLRSMAEQNQVFRSYIGMGYHDCHTPGVILRNILENPGWYTAYTPYQAEISQGRMEALLNFQTMVRDLAGMEMSNASLLDEATAAAEAMTMCQRVLGKKGADRHVFVVAADCHPQTVAVVRTRAEPLGIEVAVAAVEDMRFDDKVFGVLLQNPSTDGIVRDLTPWIDKAHAAGALACVATDLLASTMLKSPGEMGADMVLGSAQRFGVPMGYGGPHAAFLASKEQFARQMPGRVIGVTKDAHGRTALRMALQTREQHIRREKATSNICTAQVLLAVMASMYAVYHGPEGLRAIAQRVHGMTTALAVALEDAGFEVSTPFFDTLRVRGRSISAAEVVAAARARRINLRDFGDGTVGVAFDETVDEADVRDVIACFGVAGADRLDVVELASRGTAWPSALRRASSYLEHPVFHRYRSETEMLRYIHRLETKDLSLNASMISLGSCTMKLNATAEMIPVTWPEFGKLHPFVPLDQARGYAILFERLDTWLREITGFAAVSLQPNAGSQGEYTGLLAIRAYHHARGESHRDVCLIPSSAHGTNPASAAMCGMEVVIVACDEHGNIDIGDLKAKAAEHTERLAALMVTYPSTHGVFEVGIKEVCSVVHRHGGQVYMDGANMNAQVGWCRPGDIGADVCHLNLHKTFCIPHGGGGPGMGPIGVAAHLAPLLPGHPTVATGGEQAIGPVAAAPWGSASILPISYAYIAMMGRDGLKEATAVAVLNANYVAKRLADKFPVLYSGKNGMVAHECILELRHLKQVSAADVAKRLMDYGFHAPTLSFPVAGTLMVEPTESESKEELDRFCEAMVAIHGEIGAIASGAVDAQDNVVKNAPHSMVHACVDAWTHPYSREQACFPAAWLREFKYWPTVGRVDDVYGDRNLMCACPPVEAYAT
ncbi:MAG: aminomethyl-transferring glycine dehydrogenase [Planctomycetota bacterium]